MVIKRLICLLPLLTLVSCVAHRPHEEEGTHALLWSWTPILGINGEPPKDAFEALLVPGDYQLAVQYRTYRREYVCQFTLQAVAGGSYEVVDHANDQPLVLYRSVRANDLWVERRDPQLGQCNSVAVD